MPYVINTQISNRKRRTKFTPKNCFFVRVNINGDKVNRLGDKTFIADKSERIADRTTNITDKSARIADRTTNIADKSV